MKTIDIKSLLIGGLLAVVFVGCAGENKNGRFVPVDPQLTSAMLDTQTGAYYELKLTKGKGYDWNKIASLESVGNKNGRFVPVKSDKIGDMVRVSLDTLRRQPRREATMLDTQTGAYYELFRPTREVKVDGGIRAEPDGPIVWKKLCSVK